MPRFTADYVPAYRLHKRSGQAIVTIAGSDSYLGPHDSQESRKKYNKIIAEWFVAGRPRVGVPFALAAAAAEPLPVVTVNMLFATFWRHAEVYYKDVAGRRSNELENYRHAMRTPCAIFGELPAHEFGARCLKACQATFIKDGLARKTINQRCNRVRAVFRWAVGEELLPSTVLESLRAVNGLKRGRSEARETEPIKPAPDWIVKGAVAAAGRHVAAMIELQQITGMRSGELVIMRTSDVDRTGHVWEYTPSYHKTQHHGHTRIIYLGVRAQELLGPFLKMDGTAFLFSPADADAERRAALSAQRETPMSCGNRPGTNRLNKPGKKPGPCYTTASYAQAVDYACRKAFPPPADLSGDELNAWRKEHRFHPHQQRHAAATRFRRDHGLDAARALLGQKTVEAAEIYAELDMDKAREVMRLIG